ncbi:MAG: MarR family winged helix-turn-helix transcriptional regulator [Pontibacterium sp.]
MAESSGEIFTEIVLEIFKVSGMLNSEGDKLAEEFGLSSARWKIMGAIARSEQLLTVPQIGRSMGQSRQATQRLVDVMTKDGLLKLIDNPNHKRAKYIDLTQDGKRIYDELFNKHKPWALEGAKQLSKTELDTTLSALRKIAHHFGN